MKAYAGIAAVLITAGCTRQGSVSAPITAAPTAPSVSQPVSSEPGIAFHYAPPAGSMLQYSIVTSIASGADSMQSQMNVTERLIKSEPNRFTSEITLNAMLQNGATPPGIAERIGKYKLTVVRDGQGKVIESTTVGGKNLVEPGSLEERTSFALPAKPIHVGDSWTTTAKQDSKPITETFKLDSFGSLVGKECAFFSEVDESADGTKLPPKAIAVDKKTGEFVELVFDVQKPASGDKPAVHMRLEVVPSQVAVDATPTAKKPN